MATTMEESELIDAIRQRSENPETRADFATRSPSPIPPRVSQAAIEEAERRLGVALHPLHRRLFEEIGNGGFGPGNGIIGLPGGHGDRDGRSIVELREYLWEDTEHPGLPHGVVPLCDLGDGTWLCIDELTDGGTVLVLDEFGLTDTGVDLRSLLSDWVNGVGVWEKMFDIIEATGTNPFTRQPMIFKSPGRAKGTPYMRRP
jgi:hypothetical protein